MMNLQRGTGRRRLAWALLPLLMWGGAATADPVGFLGDINLDGKINILDIQKVINQALLLNAATYEADVDESGLVNVIDVQHVINTVLKEGGMIQQVEATVEVPAKMDGQPMKMVAVSTDGLYTESLVNPDTGTVNLELRVKRGWALALFGDVGNGQFHELIGVVEVPVTSLLSSTLPLPGISGGGKLDLGTLNFASPARVNRDARSLIASAAIPLDLSDADGNGVPDFIDAIIVSIVNSPHIPNSVNTSGLQLAVWDCLSALGADFSAPDPTDSDGNGVPDFLEPVVSCIREELPLWMPGQNINPPGQGQGPPDFVEQIILTVVANVAVVLEGLGRPEFVDTNGNDIPDFVEPFLALHGVSTLINPDGTGIPYFAQDSTGNGVPNIFDPSAWTPADSDGDGIPDAIDMDSNNDGIPDYVTMGPTKETPS